MSSKKRVKLADERDDDESITSSNSGSSGEGFASYSGEESSRDTDDEIADARRLKSKKTLKRKRRATEPSHFGATLQSLLNTDAPSGLPLSLKPSVARQKNDAKLELEARKVIKIERRERDEKGRIRDVIGGWGGESERSLRKVAQRGVVKLFNTIQQSQLAATVAEEEAKATRGTGKPSLPAPSLGRKDKDRGQKQSKDAFFDMIRTGGLVSKV